MNHETETKLRDFAAELKQLCKDFSDLRDRPYMGDVTSAIDSLLENFIAAEATPEEEAEDAKLVFVRSNTKVGKSISLEEMESRFCDHTYHLGTCTKCGAVSPTE